MTEIDPKDFGDAVVRVFDTDILAARWQDWLPNFMRCHLSTMSSHLFVNIELLVMNAGLFIDIMCVLPTYVT